MKIAGPFTQHPTSPRGASSSFAVASEWLLFEPNGTVVGGTVGGRQESEFYHHM